MQLRYRVMLIVAAMCCAAHVSDAQLTVKTTEYGTKPGYIDYSLLVVQPHGGYVEQSLYLNYGDHNQYPGSKIVEIVHRFRLPANAVVNDMWLWIGDSVMQAIMLDTWTARAIYDSITSSLHDPAFLAKHGEYYELHIFPLESGSVRKVKLNFITPTRWVGNGAGADLPFTMLLDNNAVTKPLDILFRQVEPVWGTPGITELPDVSFQPFRDTSGYNFSMTHIDDLTGHSSGSLRYSTDFKDGTYFASMNRDNDGCYFQFGFDPGAFFPINKDSTARRLLFAFDLSGVHNSDLSVLIPKLRQAMLASARPIDSVRLVVAGTGSIETFAPSWVVGRSDSIDALLRRFVGSSIGREIADRQLPVVEFTDRLAQMCWQFPGLTDLAFPKNFDYLYNALRDSSTTTARVIATYSHNGDILRPQINEIIQRIDDFLRKGGRVLSYFDYNRNSVGFDGEVVASHYIDSLTAPHIKEHVVYLRRVTDGNLGEVFPETVEHYVFNYLQFAADSSVEVEVTDELGRPIVISKRVGNGLLVVTSIWSFRDDGGMRALLGIPLLGLNAVASRQQLQVLLDRVRLDQSVWPADRVYLVSNSDTLIQRTDAISWTESWVQGFAGAVPHITTVNLQDGSKYVPPSVTDQKVEYYSAGYFLKTIADATGGRHFETHLYPWTSICALLDPLSFPRADSMSVTASVNSGSGQLHEIREVDPMPEDANKARFFIGSTSPASSLTFTVRAVFNGVPGSFTYSDTRTPTIDSVLMDRILYPMLGNEHLKDLFTPTKRDTTKIVSTALRYHLLCDYTALLALEPNDTLHFMRNPFDETRLLDAPDVTVVPSDDSLQLALSPNPFHASAGIAAYSRDGAVVSVRVYDVLGRLVRTIAADEYVHGSRLYRWDGLDERGVRTPAGLYLVELLARDRGTGVARKLVKNLVRLQ